MAVRTIACLPALVGAWRDHGRRGPALDQRRLRLQRRRPRPGRPVPGRDPDRQHEPTGRGPRRRAARPARPGPVCLQLQPRGRRPRPTQGPRRAPSRRPVHRRPRAVPDRHRRLCRHRPARHHPARTHRHPRLVRPPFRDAQRARASPRSASPGPTTTSSATSPTASRLRARPLPRRRDLDPPGPRRRPHHSGGSPSNGSEVEPSIRLDMPERYAPFADGNFPTPSGKCELYSERMLADGLDPLPTYTPPLEDPQADAARPRRRLPDPAPQPPPARSSSTRPSPTPRATGPGGRRPDRRTLRSRGRRSRTLVEGQWAEVYNDRGSFRARVALSGAVNTGGRRRHRASTGTSSSPAGATPTPRPPPPSPTWAAGRRSSTT